MPDLNPSPNINPNQDTRHKAPDVSDEQLARMTGIKIEVQIALAERKLGHFPKDDEFTLWSSLYAEKVNDYFFDHPCATVADLKEIEKFINEDTIIH